MASGRKMDISSLKCRRIYEEVSATVGDWDRFAGEAGVSDINREMIAKCLRI